MLAPVGGPGIARTRQIGEVVAPTLAAWGLLGQFDR
jgi:hypothetical protein